MLEQSYLLLIDPIMLSGLPLKHLTLIKPESNLFLCALNTVGAMADVSSNSNGVITSDGAWC